jgi:hypothetical protein
MVRTALPRVKPTARRWFEDRLLELGINQDAAAKRMGHISTISLGKILDNPARATAEDLRKIAEFMQVTDDWYEVMVQGFGFGLDGCSLNDFNRLLQEEGYQLDRVQHAA